jgi:hypothetical protein
VKSVVSHFIGNLSNKKVVKKSLVTFVFVLHVSDDDHQNSDWLGIHDKICQSLIPLRVPQPFLTSEEERKKRDDEIYKKKVNS